jgi:molybdopterin-guanine dinucleotide biosynthesis protein A
MTGHRTSKDAATSARRRPKRQRAIPPPISVIVLAGGRSRRLGTDKALLKLDGKWLLVRILQALSSLSDELLVVGGEQAKLAHLQVSIVSDAYPGLGPLAGIYAGLKAMRHERGLVVACDMPLLSLELLRYMILLSNDFDVVIPRIGRELEPLHAIYSSACVRPIAEELERGCLRVIGFFSQVRVRYVDQEEIDAFDPRHLSFFNINTPEELETAERLILERAKPRSRDSSRE